MNDKYISLIAKYLSGEINDQGREELFGLVNSSEEHRAYFEEMQSLWEVSGDEAEEELTLNPDNAWQKVVGRINPSIDNPISLPTEDRAPGKVFRIQQLLKIAAVFIAVVAAFLFWNNRNGDHVQTLAFQTQNEEKAEIQLPDGSTVWLNENSTLSYKEGFNPRIVQLKGEAFFDVQHLEDDRSFEIKSGETTTRVLGTSFNVRAYPKETQVEVTVTTGKVALESKQIDKPEVKVLLTAGQSGVYKKKEQDVVKETKVISNADAWKEEKLVFDDVALQEVITTLERYFNLDITAENPEILSCPLTGEYPKPKVEELIQVLEFSLDLQVVRDGNKLRLSGAGCE